MTGWGWRIRAEGGGGGESIGEEEGKGANVRRFRGKCRGGAEGSRAVQSKIKGNVKSLRGRWRKGGKIIEQE